MKEKLLAADDALLVAAQRAYLWLFDWTGVYVGTLLFLMGAAAAACDAASHGGRPCFMGWVLVILYGFLGWHRIRLQERGDKIYNANAEEETHNPMRWFFLAMFVYFFVTEIIKRDWAQVVESVIFFCVIYLMTVKIRPRDPKEFFEHKTVRARQ